MYDILSLDLQYLKGVGPSRAQLLADELKMRTFRDLLYYFPYKYIDRSTTYRIADLVGGMPHIQLRGTLHRFETLGEGRKRRLRAIFGDATGSIELMWFQGIRFMEKQLKAGEEYIVFGKPVVFNQSLSISHPDLSPADSDLPYTKGLQAFYNTTERMKRAGVTSHTLQGYVYALFERLKVQPPPEFLPLHVLDSLNLLPLDEALKRIHFPETAVELPPAERRLKFDELFLLQLDILHYAQQRQQRYQGFRFDKVGEYFHRFYSDILPFALTNAQKRVVREIRIDMNTGRQMNRLVQGDVGSGKTMVALMTMLLAIDNGFQACMMAPTEILAEQHYASIHAYVEALGLRVELLTGLIKGKRRTQILEALARGEVHILIGTHALIEPQVVFSNLGVAVIDEQHRFGVKQRALLWHKNATPPHILVMTATPIPRTLAMTVYGDLDVSVIDELPPGRKPIKTLHYYEDNTATYYAGIRKELAKGHQVYIVYPLIKESEKSDMQSLEEGYKNICEAFADYSVGFLHGKMKSAEKEAAMQAFVEHKTHILVSTTVIEVGVNVPNASVMVIQSANRFGLAQLHQLRGRVGRGADQSYCLLVTNYKLGEHVKRRMQIMLESTDGFVIAEEDMKLRGPGDIEGTQQSGIAFDLRIANLAKDGQILSEAREQAQLILERDPDRTLPLYQPLWQYHKLTKEGKHNWSSIS